MIIKQRDQIRLLNALNMNTVCCWGTWALVNTTTTVDIVHRTTKLRKLSLFPPFGVYTGSCSTGPLKKGRSQSLDIGRSVNHNTGLFISP